MANKKGTKKTKVKKPVAPTVPVAPKVEKVLTPVEVIDSKLLIKQAEFKRLRQREASLGSELEKTRNDVIKAAAAYKALDDLRKELVVAPKNPKK